MDLALGKFFLDVLKELRDMITKSNDRSNSLLATGAFLELYGSAKRIEGLAIRAQFYRKSEDLQFVDDTLRLFFDEVANFNALLKKANLSVIDIYHPKLAMELEHAVWAEMTLAAKFEKHILPELQIDNELLIRVARLYVTHQNLFSRYDSMRGAEYESRWKEFDAFVDSLKDLQMMLAEVVRSTWDFRELATLSKK